MNFKMIYKLDNYLYQYANYQTFVVNDGCSMSYVHLSEKHSDEFIKERLAKVKYYAAKVNLKLISDYMEVYDRRYTLEHLFELEFPKIKDPSKIHAELDAYIFDICQSYVHGRYPMLPDPKEIGYAKYFDKLVKYTRKLISLYEETETKCNKRKSEKEYIDPYKEITSEIMEIVNAQ